MLERCHAYLIGGDDAQTRLLEKIAVRVGFASTTAVTDLSVDVIEARIAFFLVHFKLPVAVKRATLEAIRHSQNDAVRFAPVILIADDCTFETILENIRLGYDDVVSLPERRPELAQRLESQINGDHLYIQTGDYLGPDRRRLDIQEPHHERRTGAYHHEQLTIHRSIDAGVRIVERRVML
jgi:DNA-binding NarL/FixJ family response regulator